MEFSRLLRPRSIAVIGGRPAAEVVRQNRRLGFDGPVWPVHTLLDEIDGRAVFRNVDDLPEAPDAVFLAVNRHASIAIVAQLAERGAGGVVCYASGFAEVGGEGIRLQQQLRDAAGTMPLLGPNCYGTLNYLDGVALWPDQHGGERVRRGVALLTQSGNIGLNLTMQRRGLPIAYLATLGNQAVVGLSAMIAALAGDDRITAIGLHVEAIDNANAFAAAVAHAEMRGIPVVILKTGTSEAGAKLAISHTASLAGADAVASAFFRRIGVGRVETLPELLEALKLLHVHGRLASTDIVSLSCSGGEATLFADRARDRPVRFRAFTKGQADDVRTTVPPLVTVSNPFHYHTFHWARREQLAATFTAVMRAEFALTLLVLDFPRTDRGRDDDWMIALHALDDAQRATGRAAALVSTLPENLPETHARLALELGIVPLCGLDEALVAVDVAAARSSAPPPSAGAPLPGHARTLNEWEGKRLLAANGIPVPRGMRAAGWRDAVAPCYPAVAKTLGLDHKTEHAAVRLNLTNAASVTEAARTLPPGEGLLIEEMVIDGVELITGVARDPVFGRHLLLGSGGILAELAGDSTILMLPTTESEIRAALAGLRMARLLAGYRGRPAADVDAAVAAILAVAAFADAHADRLVELDINPLIVTPTRAVAADVLIRLMETA